MWFFKNKTKISIQNLEEYLVDSFSEIRELKNKIKVLEEQAKELVLIDEEYKATLIVLNEYRKRESENKKEIKEKDNQINEWIKKLKLSQQLNLEEQLKGEKANEELYKIKKNINLEIQKGIENTIKKYKESLINRIDLTKGILSKDKIKKIIEEDK